MKKVLVVNDCRLERLVMKDVISKMGYTVETSDDISSIDTIERYRPDILIANETMNYIQGTELIRVVKDKYTGTRCYLSSCSLLQQSSLDNDVDGYFQTPISPVDLEQLLSEEIVPVQNTIDLTNKSYTSFNQYAETNGGETTAKNCLSFCPFCGDRLLAHSSTFIFCPFCGAKLP